MFLERKLKRWVDAGLITEPTKADIVSFENQSSKSSALYGVLGIGAISIVIGIISIIAANWHNISKEMKLLANFIWLTSLAIGIFIFLLVIGFIELPNLFVHGDLKIIGALYFLICRGMIAYLGVKTSNKNLFELSCIVISIRIIIIYFEVFGSLLQTGVGLISTGVFILLIAYVWHSRREKIWGLRKI